MITKLDTLGRTQKKLKKIYYNARKYLCEGKRTKSGQNQTCDKLYSLGISKCVI